MSETLHRLVRRLEEDALLFQPDQICRRLEALDLLDACFPGGPEPVPGDASDVTALFLRARGLADRMEAVNGELYQAIRRSIQHRAGLDALFRWMPNASMEVEREPVKGMGYDSLDELIAGVFAFEKPGSQSASIDSEMVFYQPTPARHILSLIRLTALDATDVLVDLGSGLGHVSLLVAVCTPARSIGIEMHASYVECARLCAQKLRLDRVAFVHGDARAADFSNGTVFYLHTPFTGSVLRSVLQRLRPEAASRPIRICTYGPCTAVVARERWLHAGTATETDQIAVFTSRV